MKRAGRTLGRAAFAAAVAAALGFGAGQAVAAPSAEARRPYCSDTWDCQLTCERDYPGQEVIGVCSSGNTCYCKFF